MIIPLSSRVRLLFRFDLKQQTSLGDYDENRRLKGERGVNDLFANSRVGSPFSSDTYFIHIYTYIYVHKEGSVKTTLQLFRLRNRPPDTRRDLYGRDDRFRTQRRVLIERPSRSPYIGFAHKLCLPSLHANLSRTRVCDDED